MPQKKTSNVATGHKELGKSYNDSLQNSDLVAQGASNKASAQRPGKTVLQCDRVNRRAGKGNSKARAGNDARASQSATQMAMVLQWPAITPPSTHPQLPVVIGTEEETHRNVPQNRGAGQQAQDCLKHSFSSRNLVNCASQRRRSTEHQALSQWNGDCTKCQIILSREIFPAHCL